MSKCSGGVLILTGIAVGAYALWPPPPTGTEVAAAQNAGRAATHKAVHKAAHQAKPPTARPQPAAGAPATPAAPSPAPAAASQSPPVTAVTLEEAPPRMPVGKAGSAAASLGGADLTREVQLQLKRIGCDPGPVDGVWGPATRRAMLAFTVRANASLPVDGPDPVLLAMVRSAKPGTCGACPPGQERTGDGHCLPAALMADAGAKARANTASSPRTTDTTARTRRTAPDKAAPARRQRAEAASRPPQGRMSLAGPRARRSTRAPRSVRRRQIYRRRMQARRAQARSRDARAAYVRARQQRSAQHRVRRRTGFPYWIPFALP